MTKSLRTALLVAVVGVLSVWSGAAYADCGSPRNAVEAENCLAGSPRSEWDVTGGGSQALRGAAIASVNRGETVAFDAGAAVTARRIDIYRLGYYGGDGARRVASTRGASWSVPSDAVSGIYLAKLVGEEGAIGAGHQVFVVRHDGGGSDILFQASGLLRAEHPMLRWLEKNGYDVSYFTALDAERRGSEILGHRVYLSAGRDAAWSPRQRASIEAALDHDPPVHLAFFGAHAASGPGARRTPENALTGTIFNLHAGDAALQVSEADGRMRFWRDTPNVSTLAPGAVWTGPEGTLGREWGEDRDDQARPAGLVRLATRVDGAGAHHAVFHKRASGALVFSAGTRQWSWGLDASVDMQQATVNLLADMGAQPATLQDGLVPASASTDVVAPVSDVTSPALGAMVSRLSPVLIEGAATDGAPGQVGGVEVSVDGGLTWHRAEGRESWSYLWTPPADGTYVILSRAVDDSGNLETPSAGVALGVGRDASRFAARAPGTRDFVTAAAGTFTDNLQADFNLGTPDANIAITAAPDGEVQLAIAPGSAEFDVFPANWASAEWATGGTATVAAGVLVVDGARANTALGLNYDPGTAIEFVATFGAAAFQAIGFGTGATDPDLFNSVPLAIFTTNSTGSEVIARVSPPTGPSLDAPLVPGLIGTSHIYKIVWQTTGFQFYVDNVLLHTQPTPLAGPMRIAVSDFNVGAPSVSVDWLRMLSFRTPGTFVSRVFDSTAAGTSWKAMTWTADTPAGTTLSMSARISATPTPTGAWIPISSSGTILGGTARYVQYRAVLGTTNALVTPVLRSVSIAYDTTVGDTTPPTIVSRTPAPGATGVPVGSPVTVQFGEVVNAATITTATFRLRAVGATTDVAAAVVTSGNVSTLTPSAALTAGTFYTVTLGATVADLSGNALGADVVWTFATATPSFTDTTLADFQAALSNTCALGSYESEGDVLLTPNAGSGFDTGALPTGWVVTPWSAGGAGTVASAVLTVDGARVDSGATVYTPRTLEFVATFGPEQFQALGWGNELNLSTEAWALFGTADTSTTLYARTNDGTGSVDVVIPGSWIGSSHAYRIDWTASQVVYSIDGTPVHTAAIAVPGPLRPVISDFTPTPSPGTLAVSGFRISPFTTPCTLQSRVFDAGFAVSWNGLTWTAAVPAQTTLAMSVRSGNVAVPDGTWTGYTTVPSSGATVSGGIGRYAQYRAVLTATNTSRTPVVSNVTVNSVAPPTQVLTVTLPTNGTITGPGINCGTGGGDCTEAYAYGTVVALTATPNTGYVLSAWTGACTGTGPCSVTMSQARTVGATFAIQRFTLTVTAPTGGTITATGINCGSATGATDCTQDYDYNTVVALTATPATGYNFTSWTGDCTGAGACSVTMTAPRTVGATFTIQRYTLTVTPPTNGTITATGINCGTGGADCSEIYDYGTVVPLTATPATGYGLTTWTGVCTGTGACSATMTTDRTVGATFSILRLTLTVTPPTNGTVTGTGIVCGTGGADCSEVFDYGTTVPLTATPDANYDFAGWSGACTGTGACSPTMTVARTVGASFTIQRFTLTVGAPTGGTITASGINCGAGGADCSETYDYGTVVALTATASTGYDFGGWTGDCSGTGACSVSMTQARAIGAIFTIQRYTLTVTPPTNGTITGTGIACGTGGADCSEIFNYGTVVPLTATPAVGYTLGGWTGACSGTGACSVTMTQARTVGATFTIQRFTLTVSPQPTNGTVTGPGILCGPGNADCSETYDYNTVVALTAVPATGYDFGGWTGACTGTGACSVTMTQARTVGTSFTIQRHALTVTPVPTNGTVTGTGITCGSGGTDCTETFDYGTVVALTATPATGYDFGGWTGACTGTGACSVTMTAARTVAASFVPERYTLTVTRPTRGTITAPGIACGTGGSDCTQDYDYGTVVAVTAVPDPNYKLRLWTGACTGTGACSLTMTVSRSVGGLFNVAFQGTKTGPGGYEGPGFGTNESEAAPAEAAPTPAPGAPAERTGPSPAPAPETVPATEPTPEIRPQVVAPVPDAPRVLVTGDVRTPGAYAWFPGMTARQLVWLAGLPDGPEDRLAIVRETVGQGPGDEIELDALVTAGETILVRRRSR